LGWAVAAEHGGYQAGHHTNWDAHGLCWKKQRGQVELAEAPGTLVLFAHQELRESGQSPRLSAEGKYPKKDCPREPNNPNFICWTLKIRLGGLKSIRTDRVKFKAPSTQSEKRDTIVCLHFFKGCRQCLKTNQTHGQEDP
jgi:hypothetical protein